MVGVRHFLRISLALSIWGFLCSHAASQTERPRIGVVLSGGGARGAAHIGFLKALEEAGVHVDCIVGTSIGALVGGYYAAGWSPEAMEAVLESGEFTERISGGTDRSYPFKNSIPTPTLFQLRWSSGDRTLKSNLVASLSLDYAMMEELAPANAASRGEFDALWIPFRCVGSNVLTKQDTVFRDGDLARSIRASMAFPFYFQPVWMEGVPVYDGGLYNNLPIDVMQSEFNPEVVLVSSVISEQVDFSSDDLMSQVEALIMREQSNVLQKDSLLVFQPELQLSTFDFANFSKAIDAGYQNAIKTLKNSDLIKFDSTQFEIIDSRRNAFRSSLPPFNIAGCQVSGLSPEQMRYASRFLGETAVENREQTFRRNVMLLDSDEHIGRIDPTAHWNSLEGAFDVHLNVEAERELFFEVGGSFPSNATGFGFLGAAYNRFSRLPMKVQGRMTFGNFYSGGDLGLRFDVHREIPIAVELSAMQDRLQFDRAIPAFFQPLTPAFLISEEREAGVRVMSPVGLHGVLGFSHHEIQTTDWSYANWLFDPSDTADTEQFSGGVTELFWTHDDLDAPQLPRSGSNFKVRLQRFSGISTALYQKQEDATVGWNERTSSLGFLRFKLDGTSLYSVWDGRFAIGWRTALALSDEPLRSTYRATLAQAMPYVPMQGSQARFLESFRAFNFAAAGGLLDVRLLPNVFLRAEVHAFQAFEGIYQGEKGPGLRDKPPTRIMAGVRLHSTYAIGPISLGLEYYESERSPWFAEVHWGYRILRRTSRRD